MTQMRHDFPHPLYFLRLAGALVEFVVVAPFVIFHAVGRWTAEKDRSHHMTIECHGLDTPERVCFYEQDFYVLSNFSAFRLCVDEHTGLTFDTLEAAYHYYKFKIDGYDAFNESRQPIRSRIRRADSAYDAFKIAEKNKDQRRQDWDAIKVDVMRRLLRLKVQQHEYVSRKLLATGDRELVENSWRDDFWGWGPNKDGQNMLGKLWMEVRAELRTDPNNPET